MENEPVELGVEQQDIENINEVLKKSGTAVPILPEGNEADAVLPVTKDFLTGINAWKKRLQDRNLQLTVKKTNEEKPTDSITVLEEGIHRSGCLNKWWDQTFIYQREEKEISSFCGDNTFSYYILKAPDGNCNVSSIYITFYEYFGREKESIDADMKEDGLLGIFLALFTVIFYGAVFVVCVLSFLYALLHHMALGYKLLILLMILGMGGALGMLAKMGAVHLVKYPVYRKKRIYSRQVTAKLLEKEPEFCLEKFLGILNSKLLRLLYADGTEEIGAIVSCDMAQFLQDHEDVVNCEFLNFWFTDMREDGDYMYLDVVYKVTLYRDMGTKIKRRKQLIYLQLGCPLHGIMESDLYNDWSIINIETNKK